jgi:hypothetical protein
MNSRFLALRGLPMDGVEKVNYRRSAFVVRSVRKTGVSRHLSWSHAGNRDSRSRTGRHRARISVLDHAELHHRGRSVRADFSGLGRDPHPPWSYPGGRGGVGQIFQRSECRAGSDSPRSHESQPEALPVVWQSNESDVPVLSSLRQAALTGLSLSVGPGRLAGRAGHRNVVGGCSRQLSFAPFVPGFPAQKLAFLGRRPVSCLTSRPGRGSKPHSGSGSIRLRALLDGQGNSSSRRSGLASGEAAVSPYPDGTSGAPPSPYHRAVSLLLRSSDSRPSGSHPTPCSPKWGLSSAAGRCRRGPPSAALHLLARERGERRGK